MLYDEEKQDEEKQDVDEEKQDVGEAPDDPSREPATRDPHQPDHDSLEVVTTSPEDGRRGPGRTRRHRSCNNRPGGLSADDPFWTFGTPPESWGSSVRKPDGEGDASSERPRRARVFLECRTCGVKIEKKRAHGRGKVPCSMCGRWMQVSRQD